MRQDQLPRELLINAEIMFGYNLRLLIEDLKSPVIEEITILMPDIHRRSVVHVGWHYGFTVVFEAPEVVSRELCAFQRILVRCLRNGSKHSNISFF